MVRVRSKTSGADVSQPLGRRGLLSLLAASSVAVGLILDWIRSVKRICLQEDPNVTPTTTPFALGQQTQHSIVAGAGGQFSSTARMGTDAGKVIRRSSDGFSGSQRRIEEQAPGVVAHRWDHATGSVAWSALKHFVAIASVFIAFVGCESNGSQSLKPQLRPVVADKQHFFVAWQSDVDHQLYESNAGPGRWVIVPHGTLFFVGSPQSNPSTK